MGCKIAKSVDSSDLLVLDIVHKVEVAEPEASYSLLRLRGSRLDIVDVGTPNIVDRVALTGKRPSMRGATAIARARR